MTQILCQANTTRHQTTGAFRTTRSSWTSSPMATRPITISSGPSSSGIGGRRISGLVVISLDWSPNWTIWLVWASRLSSPLVPPGSTCSGKRTVRRFVYFLFGSYSHLLGFFFFHLPYGGCMLLRDCFLQAIPPWTSPPSIRTGVDVRNGAR